LVREQKTGGRFAGAYGAMGYPSGVAVTAMAGLAMLASGDPPGEGKYGKALDRSIDYIARAVQDTGFISVANGMDQMYGHGFATMFLSEIVGMSRRRDDLRDKVKKAVELIVTCQNDQGGWRYAPQKSDADLSITICQIMALRAASDSGLSVPKETRAKAIDYVKRSQRPDGGFMYMLPQGQVTFPLTAAGVVSLYSAGIFQGREIESGLKYLMRFMPGRGGTESVGHYFYGHYYAVQAMWHAGGDYWRQWYPAIRQELLSRQQANGSWQDPSVCEQFGTAVACIILQMPNNALPIFAE
ncbi:MAG: terpene cyclase/mutase family protein, partial [Planctomycetia bacterium]|nr:terpene cyclase/mutase family protein [Planctomycetia bacterium]